MIQYYVEEEHKKVQLFHCQPSFLRSQCAVQHFQHHYLNIWQHEAGHVGAPQTASEKQTQTPTGTSVLSPA